MLKLIQIPCDVKLHMKMHKVQLTNTKIREEKKTMEETKGNITQETVNTHCFQVQLKYCL